jgi:GNAT superfamily N-acetyltransferase
VEELSTMFACMTAFQVALGLAARGGRPFEHEGLIAAIVPGLPDLAVANAAVYRDSAGLASALPLLERAYEAAGVRRSLVWVPPNDHRAYEALRAAGYAADSEAPAMALDLALLPAEDDPPDDWTDAPEPAEIAHIVERSYGLADGAIGAAIRGWLEPATTYLARLDGRPACCLTMVRQGPDAGVFLVGTIPEARGRGLARRLLLHALHGARDAGATVSTLQSSRLGYPVYRRLGYVELCRLGMWERGR